MDGVWGSLSELVDGEDIAGVVVAGWESVRQDRYARRDGDDHSLRDSHNKVTTVTRIVT